MDVTQVGLGLVLLAVASLMLAGGTVSNSQPVLYFLTAAALVVTTFATLIAALRDRRGTPT